MVGEKDENDEAVAVVVVDGGSSGGTFSSWDCREAYEMVDGESGVVVTGSAL